MEKDRALEKCQSLETEVLELNGKIDMASQQIESLESEKSNLLFELNELQTREILVSDLSVVQARADSLMLDNCDLKERVTKLQSQFLDLEQEKKQYIEEKSNKIKELLQTIRELNEELDTKNDVEAIKNDELTELKQVLQEKETKHQRIEQESNELRQNLEEFKRITLQLDQEVLKNVQFEEASTELHTTIKILEEKIQQLETNATETVKNLEANELKSIELKVQQQESSTPTNVVINTEIQDLKDALDFATNEKNNLILLIQTKQQENIKYYEEIQRLGKLLTIEIEKSKNCSKCIELVRHIETLQLDRKQKEEKLNDQITFLKEKADILTQNVLTEEQKQQLVKEEMQQINNDKLSLAKDLGRLREHLLEVEEAHTLETVELQKTIEESKKKMMHLEEEVKKSSNAYTSAK